MAGTIVMAIVISTCRWRHDDVDDCVGRSTADSATDQAPSTCGCTDIPEGTATATETKYVVVMHSHINLDGICDDDQVWLSSK